MCLPVLITIGRDTPGQLFLYQGHPTTKTGEGKIHCHSELEAWGRRNLAGLSTPSVRKAWPILECACRGKGLTHPAHWPWLGMHLAWSSHNWQGKGLAQSHSGVCLALPCLAMEVGWALLVQGWLDRLYLSPLVGRGEDRLGVEPFSRAISPLQSTPAVCK